MKRFLILFLSTASFFTAHGQIAGDSLYVRDPFIFADRKTKTYYLHVNKCPSIGLYTSKDLKTWTESREVFTIDSTFWGEKDCWAPDVYFYRGKYYLLVSYGSRQYRHGTAILVSNKITGPFKPLINKPITPNDMVCIDASLYFDAQNKPWLVFVREWIEVRDGQVVAQRLSDDLKTLVGEPKILFKASDAPWTAALNNMPDCYVTDAPIAYRSKSGELLMTWSSFTKDGKYAIGISKSKNGLIDGEWEHELHPLNSDDGGHAMIFRDFDNNLKLSYHCTNSRPRLKIVDIFDRDGKLSLSKKDPEKSWGNPIIDNIGLTDPHIFIHNDTAFLFATHDFSPRNHGYQMRDWWVWQSTDLLNWRQLCRIKPEETFIGKPFNDCWATFGVFRNNLWYFYFSAGQNEIGVVTSPSAAGPWTDPLGKAMIEKGLTRTEQRDPDILIDDDGEAYIVYGTFRYFIARLNKDMISLAEQPRRIELDRQYGPYGEGKTDDKPSLHKYNGRYYLSWCGFYAMADNVYGPYRYKGALFDSTLISPEFSFNDYRFDRHGNIFTYHNQWYYTFNDFSREGRSHHYRDACIAYLHYLDNGEIAPVAIDTVGVGQYDARVPIEAENYFKAENAVKRQCPKGGFEMTGITDGSTLAYSNVRNIPANAEITFHYSSRNRGGAKIEIYDRYPDGKLLGECILPETLSWNIYGEASCRLNFVDTKSDLVLVFRGEGDELARVDKIYFTFE